MFPQIVSQAPVVMSPETHPDCYGPNYRTAKDERRVTRKATSLSWFDAWAFAVFFLAPIVLLWAVAS